MKLDRTTEEVISELNADDAFALIEFYEESASVVKGRTWTITAWVLTLNSALFAFCFQLYINNSDIYGFIWIVAAICCVGILLCIFLMILIRDQGEHLRYYWTNEQKIGAWNKSIQKLILTPSKIDDVLKPNFKASVPQFCKNLTLLSLMYAVGFLGTFALMYILT